MKRGNRWLSTPAEQLADECERACATTGHDDVGLHDVPMFDVVVVGSGYGGAVAAARLSALAENEGASPMRVAVLERGLEYTPGSFPDRFSDLAGHLRVNAAGWPDGATNALGLMDWRIGGDVAALVANGLGGGSLINAGVCEPASDEALSRDTWPAPWRGNGALWQALYSRARDALGARAWPQGLAPKQQAMRHVACALGASCRPVALSITPPGGDTGGAVPTRECIGCGDCFSGCNVGAKRTLGHNYLARAWRQGATLYTGATVHSVHAIVPTSSRAAAAEGNHGAAGDRYPQARWLVHWRLTDPGRLPGSTAAFKLRARHVVLAAGTFGSTEILMRSRDAGLALSGRLGEGFSANGDVLSAWYGTPFTTRISPDENLALPARACGPTITSQISWHTAADANDARKPPVRHVVQDLTVPGALGWVFREVVTTMMVPQRWTRLNLRPQRQDGPDPYAVDESAIERSLLTVAYVDDGAAGRLQPSAAWATGVRDGQLVVRWSDPGGSPAFKAMDARLSAAMPGSVGYLRNPLQQFMPRDQYLGLGQGQRRLLTVHPLGGCRMAENARDGVVDAWGAVFNTGLGVVDDGNPRHEANRNRLAGDHARTVHAGLYVLDGSIIPAALGINPLLTITAMAEGAVDEWQRAHGWCAAAHDDRPLPPLQLPDPPPAGREREQPTRVRFRERMSVELPRPDGRQRAEDDVPVVLSMMASFQEIADLRHFVGQSAPGQRARELKLEADFEVRAGDALVARVGAVKGTVRWLVPEPDCVGLRFVRALRTYFATRACADFAESRQRGLGLFDSLCEKIVGASHFGAIRQLAYEFEALPQALEAVHAGTTYLDLAAGTRLRGTKRVGYFLPDPRDPWSANPWRQLTELPLDAEAPRGGRSRIGTLEFDQLASLDRYDMPLAVTGQANAIAAMRDLAALALYFGRVMFGLHMFSFRRAEYPCEVYGPRGLRRLPPANYDGDPRFPPLRVDAYPVTVPTGAGERLCLQLTRIRLADTPPTPPTCLPVLLLHGFGSGGVQFTHPDIPQPMAPWLAARGHDVWVGELRTSIGLPSSRRQWSMDEIARDDVPALVNAVLSLTEAPQVHVVAHCIGSAMFCMAMLSGRLHGNHGSRVASATLMQVGPELVLPRESRARAYVAARLRQLVGLSEVDSVASQKPGDAESFFDRLITSVPPAKDDDERRAYRLTGDVARNAERINALRSAVIFGRLFQHANMRRGQLRVLDDLLGSCNLTTYEQTVQYAYEARLTDQAGQDVYVTEQNLRRYFNVPVLLLHGAKNATFGPRTLKLNTALFQGFNTQVRTVEVPGYGHLDCVVGDRADERVFKHVHERLAGVESLPAAPRAAPRANDHHDSHRVRLPRVGPWIGDATSDANGNVRLRVGLRLDTLGRDVQGVATLARGQGAPAGPCPHPDADRRRHERTIEITLPPGATGDLDVDVVAVNGAWPTSAQALHQGVRERLDSIERKRDLRGLPPEALRGLRIDGPWLARLRERDPQDLGLVLGACRQRPLLVDRELADASMKQVVGLLDQEDGEHAPIDAVILCGDQVYADSRVDAGNTASMKLRFLDAHHEAWSAPHQREVFRRRPVYMTVDDHEFRNDYNDVIARGRPQEFDFARQAWQRYQKDAGPPPPQAGAAWREFRLRGFPVFLADTRSERADPPQVDRRHARIMSDRQMERLCAWLGKCHDGADRDRTKIVVFGTPIAPAFAEADDRGSPGAALCSDGWQRFPVSTERLLGRIADLGIRRVLFLAGDYHRPAHARLTLRNAAGREVTVDAVVTGGLYCPYPFANATTDEWLAAGTFALGAGGASWSYQLQPLADSNGSGFMRLSLRVGHDPLVQWVRADT